MLKNFYCVTPTRRVRAAWLSIQPDGSISFGFSDRNLPPDPPHVTFHPGAYFHVTEGKPPNKTESFGGIMDLGVMLTDGPFRWVEATTRAIHRLTASGPVRAARPFVDADFPVSDEDHSLRLTIDLLGPDESPEEKSAVYYTPSPHALVRVAVHLVPAQNAELVWYHES